MPTVCQDSARTAPGFAQIRAPTAHFIAIFGSSRLRAARGRLRDPPPSGTPGVGPQALPNIRLAVVEPTWSRCRSMRASLSLWGAGAPGSPRRSRSFSPLGGSAAPALAAEADFDPWAASSRVAAPMAAAPPSTASPCVARGRAEAGASAAQEGAAVGAKERGRVTRGTSGGLMGPWARQKKGRPRRRWETPWGGSPVPTDGPTPRIVPSRDCPIGWWPGSWRDRHWRAL